MTPTDKVQAMAKATKAGWVSKRLAMGLIRYYDTPKPFVRLDKWAYAACREYSGILRGALWQKWAYTLDKEALEAGEMSMKRVPYLQEAKDTVVGELIRVWCETLRNQ